MKWFRKELRKVLFPIVKRYGEDVSFKVYITLYRSLLMNVAYAVLKFSFSIWYQSVWFATIAVYYFVLAVIRFLLLRYSGKKDAGSNLRAEWRRYRTCGALLLLINLALTGVVILVVEKNEGFSYRGYWIYVMAMYAFYNVSMAIVNVIKYRKYQSPVFSAAKALQLAVALVSMLSLETAMLEQFLDRQDSEAFRRIMTGCTGAGVCWIVLGMAIYMIRHATKELRRIEMENAL